MNFDLECDSNSVLTLKLSINFDFIYYQYNN